MPIPPEQWFVTGTDRHGNPYPGPLGFEDFDTEQEATDCAARIHNHGGKATVEHVRWNGPAASYRKVNDHA